MAEASNQADGGQVPVLLARQPILDGRERIQGYELLFRTPAGGSVGEVDPDRATAQLLTAVSGDLDLDELTGGRPAWINVTRSFLLAHDPLPLDPGHFVFELLEDQLLDALLLERLQRLRGEGHVLALDDFAPDGAAHEGDGAALLALATYVKLDVRALGAGFAAVSAPLLARGLVVLAEKVETRAEHEQCAAAGATLFQGYFFERPHHVAGRPVPTGPVGRLQTALALQREHDRDVIAQTISSDPGLSVRLLRYANSAAVGARRPVASVREALILLGARPVRQWALMVLLSELGASRPALVAVALVRARLCELIARQDGAGDPDAFFAVGLLSIVDALLDQPLARVLATLPLADSVRDALLEHAGAMGEALALAVSVQHGGGGQDGLRDAVAWSEATLRSLA